MRQKRASTTYNKENIGVDMCVDKLARTALGEYAKYEWMAKDQEKRQFETEIA